MKRYSPGIENLDALRTLVKGKERIGLLTNPSGVDSSLSPTIDILHRAFRLHCLFAPEHGIRGELQAGVRVPTYVDEKTGLTVYSAYRESYEEELSGLDCLIYDIQDVGARHYTYPYLLASMMKLCAKHSVPILVLDRYDPLGLDRVEGNIYDNAYSCGVGGYSLPTRYALTIGELAQYINREFGIGCELNVVKCEGLTRRMDHRTCRPHWILPSPNCPTYETALTYIGTVLFEGTNLSEGRGTTKPFEYIGAPWLDADAVIEEMRALYLPGVAFGKVFFTPTFSKHQGECCRGIQLHVTDPDLYEPYRTGLLLLDRIRRMHTAFEFRVSSDGTSYFIDKLAGTDALRCADFDPIAYLEAQKPLLEKFKEKAKNYYLYEY